MINETEDTKPKEVRELVYFLLDHFDEDNSYVKIGKCTVQVEDNIEDPQNQAAVYGRLRGIKTGNPRPLLMLGYLYGLESYWHRVFHTYRVDGEWFNFQPIKGIILNLRLAQVPAALNNWILSQKREVTNMIQDQISSWLSEEEKKKLYKKEENELNKIDKYTWENYVKSYTNEGNYDLIDNEITRNKWQTGRGRLDDNQILNQHRENSEEIIKLLNLIFRGDTQVKTKSRNSIIDHYNDIIHEGEPYYNLEGEGWTQANGISVRNAVTLWQRANPKLIEYAKKLVEKDEKEMREALNTIDRGFRKIGAEKSI